MREEQTLYTLYKHKCKANGKVYIGITHQNAQERWKEGKGYQQNYRLYTDILQYGWEDGFEHEIINENLSYDDVKNMESTFIRAYESTNPEKGYNGNLGGSYGAYRNLSGIGEKIKALRKAKKEKQADLAQAIGQERSTVACYETDKREPTISVLRQIARHYCVSLDYFVIESFELKSDIYMKTIEYFKDTNIPFEEKMMLFNNICSSYAKYVVDKDM